MEAKTHNLPLKPDDQDGTPIASSSKVSMDEEVEHTAPLERYILRAEKGLWLPSRSGAVFESGRTVENPMLVRGRPNRIILYSGCFNPPHRGHLELLSYAFLNTDDGTIAAIVLPADDGDINNKAYSSVNGRSLQFSRQERTELWNDPVLRRFSWILPSFYPDAFVDSIHDCALLDGYEIVFAELMGANHVGVRHTPASYYAAKVMTSDITRPTSLLAPMDGYKRLLTMEGFKDWAEIQSSEEATSKGEKWTEGLHWAARKLARIYPEKIYPDIFTSSPPLQGAFQANVDHILEYCRPARGSAWVADNLPEYGPWNTRQVLFLLSGRKYPQDKARPEVSSTMIRRIMSETPIEGLEEKLKDLVLNPKMLVEMLKRKDMAQSNLQGSWPSYLAEW